MYDTSSNHNVILLFFDQDKFSDVDDSTLHGGE